MFNHPEIKFLQSEFQCLHLSARVRIFSHYMTSYNFDANAVVRIVEILLIVVILALWIENGEKLDDGYILSNILMFYFSKWVWPLITLDDLEK
jgi:hypothetical protein